MSQGEGGSGEGERPVVGEVIAGKFRVERLLKRGGMGSVWVGTHLGLDVPVAMKFISKQLIASQSARTRFEREAKAAAQLRSQNVVQLLDHGVDRGLPYMVMELLEGEDLGARFHRESRLSIADTSRIVTPIARALVRAHEAGLIHRDLKPENIFLARDGDQQIPKVLDFGIAKVRAGVEADAGVATQDGALLGTPYYMSPEQARGRMDIDWRSDLWSLGVIVFRAIVGVKPFRSKTIGDVIFDICAGPIPRATELAPDLPPETDAFFARCLAREPANRFQSAKELAEALAELAAIAKNLPAGPAIEPVTLEPTPHPLPASTGGGDPAARVLAGPSTGPGGDPTGGTLGQGAQSIGHEPDRRRRALPLVAALATVLGAALALVLWSPWRAAPVPAPALLTPGESAAAAQPAPSGALLAQSAAVAAPAPSISASASATPARATRRAPIAKPRHDLGY